MSKLIEQSQPQTLKICYGNDFSLNVSVSIWDADTSAWSKLDLSAASDVELFLVAQNGKRIKTTSSIEQDGSLVAQIPSTYLSKTLYSIEITFKMDGRNRRTYSPCMIQIVNSTDEAGASVSDYVTNDAYHFDIMVKNDVAWLNIGALPSEYVTEEELGNVLVSYVKTEVLNSTLSNYVTNSSLSTTLNNYVTTSGLNTTLSDYVTSTDLGTTLNDYATTQYVDDAVSQIDLSDYYTSSQVDTMLSGYVNDAEYDSTDHQILLKNNDGSVPITIATIDASPFIVDGMVDDVEVSNGNLVISFNTDAGKQDISIPISQIFDASNYYTSSQVDTMLTNYASQSDMTTAQGDITSLDDRVTTLENNPSVPTDYVSYTYLADNYISYIELDNYTETISTALLNDRRDIFNTYSYFNNYYDKSQSDSRYVTSLQVSARYVDYDSLNNLAYGTSSALNDLNDRVTTIEQGGGSSSGVSEEDWDNSNEAIAQELLDNRLAHLAINENFSYYYTKTASDSRYASKDWSSGKFVTQADDVNRQEAISAAIASSVQSTYIHNIWSGSQSDYNQLTPDSYTLYVIL